MSIIKILLTIVFLALTINNLHAETEIKAAASYSYEKTFGSSPSDDDLKNAQEKAKEAAWNLYTSKFDLARMKQYGLVEGEIKKDLGRFIISSVLVENQIDEKAKTITSIVKIKINDVALDMKLSTLSKAGQTASGEGSAIVFIFTARQVDSLKSFEDKKVSIKQSKSSKKSTDTMDGDTDALSEESFEKTTTGGSTEKKSAVIKYKKTTSSISSEELDNAMNAVLSPNGFEVIAYDDVVNECEGVEKSVIDTEFIEKNAMSRLSRKAATKASRDCDVKYLSVGTLDIGAPGRDTVTGDIVITVSVRAQVKNIEKRLPKTVASIGPIQASGTGSDEQVAGRNALKEAAIEAAKALVNQLNAKGLN